MPKKQISIPENLHETLHAVALSTGKSEIQLISEALEQYLSQLEECRKLEKLLAVAGLWKNRKDLPNVRTLRKSWNRRVE